MAQANHLLEPLSPQVTLARVCLAVPAKPVVSRPLQPVDFHQPPARRCPLGARPHELAVECSSDFLF
jgi:hypothetical protein